MSGRFHKCLDATGLLSYSWLAFRAKERLKGSLDRVMRFSFTRFAYFYRFSFTEERAGETRAVGISKTS
jgi:hypothetical protein